MTYGTFERGKFCTMSFDIIQDNNAVSDSKDDVPVVKQPTTRGGLRVYKIVVLGDGGVGKSGICYLILYYLIKSNHSYLGRNVSYSMILE